MKDEMIGRKFNKLTVIERLEDVQYTKKQKTKQYLCQCECGRYVKISYYNLIYGKTKSCGCLKSRYRTPHLTHGMTGTRIYEIWTGMKKRCENPKANNYHLYGGRGIKLCKEWHSFGKFYRWAIENGYNDKLTIDRIDVNKDYEPSNCKWSTFKEQANNKRNTVYITVNNETKCITEWAKLLNIPTSTLSSRIHCFGNVSKVITKPYRVSVNSKYVYVDKYGEYQKRVQHE